MNISKYICNSISSISCQSSSVTRKKNRKILVWTERVKKREREEVSRNWGHMVKRQEVKIYIEQKGRRNGPEYISFHKHRFFMSSS